MCAVFFLSLQMFASVDSDKHKERIIKLLKMRCFLLFNLLFEGCFGVFLTGRCTFNICNQKYQWGGRVIQKTALAIKLVYKIACGFLREEKDGPKAEKKSIYLAAAPFCSASEAPVLFSP